MRILPAVLVTSAAVFAQSWCEPSPEVESGFNRIQALNDIGLTYSEKTPKQRAIYEELLAAHSGDPHLHTRYQQFLRIQGETSPAEIAERYRKLYEQHPEDALYRHLYGKVLVNYKTDEALAHMKAALEKSPQFALPHLVLADIYSYGRFLDRTKAREHITAYFKTCPEMIDSGPHSTLMRFGDETAMADRAKTLRSLLESSSSAAKLTGYDPLWDLEFKTQPPPRHPELRKQIVTDIASIRKRVPEPDLRLLRTIRQGHKLAGDTPGFDAVGAEIAARAPNSNEAIRVTVERWEQDHARPGAEASDADKDAYNSARVAAVRQWIEQWPHNTGLRVDLFYSANESSSLPPAEYKSIAEQMLAFVQRNQEVWSVPPFAMIAARGYLKRNIAIEDVPRLANAGFKEYMDRETGRHSTDRGRPEDKVGDQRGRLRLEMDLVDLLAQAYLKLGEPERAKELLARLPPPDPKEAWFNSMRLRVRGRIAELQNQKIAALTYYESASDQAPRKDKTMEADIKRLWTELGGTDETWALRAQKKPAESASQSGTWKAPETPIPAFDLTDLAGKRWKTDHFAGKTVLINVWATWCGPCIAEHPHFQKLYDRLKDRKDVAVISLNIDEEVGAVQPYMDTKKFTFPVLLGAAYVNSVLDRVSIPRNWLLNARGVHQYEQIGFGEAAGWEDGMVTMVEKVATKP